MAAYKRKSDVYLGYQEIADELGCSRQAVQQAERRAFKKLKRWFARKGLSRDDIVPDSEVGEDNEFFNKFVEVSDKRFYGGSV